MNKQILIRRCSICDLVDAVNNRTRCHYCGQLIHQASNTGASKRRTSIRASVVADAIRRSSRLHSEIYPDSAPGYACEYTQIQLNTDKSLHRRGDYASIDHAVPNNPTRAVICSLIINDLKGWMTDLEFRTFVVNILDSSADRKIYGLTFDESKAFFAALQIVMANNDVGSPAARATLKNLSSKVIY
jgi:hypothetical protein